MSLAIALIVLAGISGAIAQSEPDSFRRDDLLEIERARDESAARETALRQAAQDLAAEIEAVREQLINAAARAQEHEAQVSLVENQVDDLKGKEANLSESVRRTWAELVDTVAALQRLDRQPPPALAVQPTDAVASARGAMLMAAAIPALESDVQRIREELQALFDVQQTLGRERTRLAAVQTALDEERHNLAALLETKRGLESDARIAAEAEHDRVTALAAMAESLGDLIARLEREADVLPLPRPGDKPSGQPMTILPPVTSDKEEQPRLALLGPQGGLLVPRKFSDARGSLRLPVSGQIRAAFGTPDGLGGNLKGIRVATRSNAQVVAPFDGYVLFAGPFRGYGEVLILSPGEGYHIVLAGLARISVVVGQRLLAGEPVGNMGVQLQPPGTVGIARDSLSMTLYIEFRKDGDPFDPVPWLAARDRNARG